ncbi:kazal-type serine protease inhibitor domain-containing protein 1-like [Ornithorhynchus anatinus]|uniref:Ovomucoid n=1 Tax=Ornithorhynchus anatinus TaxID=9258 RepID=F6Y1K2_ORNAN|nr:kazal-type serine protease inhibitor domain-containing protein 1-like [Ornithorhynchus anatinus]
MKLVVKIAILVVLMPVFQSLPISYHRNWLRLLREGNNCGKCDLKVCSKPENCPAGTVLDQCGCCPECGNVEGQVCDLDGGSHFYGQCGHHLECVLDSEELKHGEIPEPQCICKSQESVCGPEGKTYENICRFNEVYFQKKTNLSMKHKGPCESAPVISLPPQDAQNFTGSDILFGCEVSAYPMPHLEWKKKGNKMFLPGYDAHISIQVRGGPLKYGMTGWLQIQGIRKSDEGVYICHTKNKYGSAYASARLKVIDNGSSSSYQLTAGNRITNYNPHFGDYYDHFEEDEEYESGDYEKGNQFL